VNLIHTPAEAGHEEALVDLLLRADVPRVSASAFGELTPAVVRCAVAGLRADRQGDAVRARHLFAKVSRPEVAERFLSPAPVEILRIPLDAEYDVPDLAWYFDRPTMPVSVLMEIALQPCGWLGCYVGSPVQMDTELLFRNLDGDLRVFREVRPDTAVVCTKVRLTAVSHINGMIIESFEIECVADGAPLLRGTAVFGYFAVAAFADQPGLPASPDTLAEPCSAEPPLHGGIAGPMLMMLDRITGYWPDGGSASLGWVRAEMDVDPGAWFFKAHFFQDPVMPGSLGVEAMCQLLRWYLIDRGVGAERFVLAEPLKWTYRGQIVPDDRLVTVELDVLEVSDTAVFATAWLWVDGRRIYRLERFGLTQ
jgi:3-hydroxymyristoyl/3-hydroxydecanoyl-(acyl carrier protein) dehydratase